MAVSHSCGAQLAERRPSLTRVLPSLLHQRYSPGVGLGSHTSPAAGAKKISYTPLISDAGPRTSTLHDPISTSTPPPAPQPEPALPGPQLWTRAWTPITPVSYLDPSRPLPLMLLGQPLVIWRHATAGWLVMSDVCPHRLAPLSEGRLEAGGIRLACAYHGWEFNQAGTCTRVPQLAADERAATTATASPRSCVTTFPTLEHDGVLFMWLDGSAEGRAAAAATPAPQLMEKGVTTFLNWSMNELPNDYSFWLEQGMDPSHANFLHHGMGNLRMETYMPMKAQGIKDIQLTTGYNWQHGPYQKRLEGMTCRREFVPPYTTRFTYDSPSGKRESFCTMIVPVRPGVSRTFFAFGTGKTSASLPATPEATATNGTATASKGTPTAPANNTDPAPEKAASVSSSSSSKSSRASPFLGNGLAGAIFRLMRSMPHWVSGGQAFADQDVVIMCRQEMLMRRQALSAREYNLNSPADLGVAAVGSWLRKAGYPRNLWGPQSSPQSGLTFGNWPQSELPLELLLSRHERHVRYCVVCQRGLKLMTKVCKALTGTAMLAAFTTMTLVAVAMVSKQGVAAVGGWGALVGAGIAAVVLAVAAVRGWEVREERFISGATRWRQTGGYSGMKSK